MYIYIYIYMVVPSIRQSGGPAIRWSGNPVIPQIIMHYHARSIMFPTVRFAVLANTPSRESVSVKKHSAYIYK